MTQPIRRRRFLTISAAAVGLPLLGFPISGAARPDHLRRWQGTALGARATVLLNHPDAAEAERLIESLTAEIRRLEGIFSLFQPESAVSLLNRDGVLLAPPADLTVLLSRARDLSEITGGAFDMTVQPLWRLYADHFGRPGADPSGPAAAEIEKARQLVDFRAVEIDSARISLARPGMAITLNGIAQGYVTDRVADLLRRNGIANVLVDIGETRALGHHPDGRNWRAGVRDPENPGRTLQSVDLSEMALATSGGYGSPFDPSGRHHHLFDPSDGRSAGRYRSISVVAPTATVADGLSTALASVPLEAVAGCLAAAGASKALLVSPDGSRIWKSA